MGTRRRILSEIVVAGAVLPLSTIRASANAGAAIAIEGKVLPRNSDVSDIQKALFG